MALEDRNELLIRAAELYYEEGLNQHDISKMFGTSRPTVSRMLEEAKESGVVEIIVHNPIQKDHKLANALRERLGLRDAIVVSGQYEYERGIRRCCRAALQFFYAVVENNLDVGISWGLVPQYFCDMMEDRRYYNVNVVQMAGSLGTGDPSMDGMELALKMSRKLGGTYSGLCAPVYVRNQEVHNYLMQEPQVEATIRKAMQSGIVITGIGTLDAGTTLQRAGCFTNQERLDMVSHGAVGHLMGRMVDRYGQEFLQKDRFPIAVPLEALRKARWSIGVSAAAFKAEAALAAVRGGYINVLIVDEALARRILELI